MKKRYNNMTIPNTQRRRRKKKRKQQIKPTITYEQSYVASSRPCPSRSRREDVLFDDETMEVLELLYNIMEFFDNGITCY
ncbi:MAG: hypothetical protein WBI94_06100 [Candidatus Cloacimonadaceae bacterium]|jgi:hypothetical protein